MRFWPEPPKQSSQTFLAWPEKKQFGRVGVMLANLGTPDEPTPDAIRRFLREFLSDPRVIEIPKLIWWPILNGPILTFRPRKLVHRYQSIWMNQGSPLLVYTQRQAAGIREIFNQRGMDVEVETGMRYGNPSIQRGLLSLRDKGCEQILIVPLYPQYAASTTATVVDEVTRVASHLRNQPALRFIKRFNTDPLFINPLGDKIAGFWQQNGRPQKLVMSFHGLPQRVVDMGDPYCKDCYQTAEALANYLGLKDDQYMVTFQSRFGRAKWLEPYTEPTVQKLAGQGITDIDVVCPGFLTDCLETLEEIQLEVREAFLAAGGKQYRYIPALNDDSAWIESLANLVQSHLQGWPTQIE